MSASFNIRTIKLFTGYETRLFHLEAPMCVLTEDVSSVKCIRTLEYSTLS
jgi:hypothetical protein